MKIEFKRKMKEEVYCFEVDREFINIKYMDGKFSDVKYFFKGIYTKEQWAILGKVQGLIENIESGVYDKGSYTIAPEKHTWKDLMKEEARVGVKSGGYFWFCDNLRGGEFVSCLSGMQDNSYKYISENRGGWKHCSKYNHQGVKATKELMK